MKTHERVAQASASLYRVEVIFCVIATVITMIVNEKLAASICIPVQALLFIKLLYDWDD